MFHPLEKIGSETSEEVWSHRSYSTQEEIWKVESHGLKPVVTPRASKDGTLRSIPHYAHNELQGVTHRAFIHGLKACGFLRRRVKEEQLC